MKKISLKDLDGLGIEKLSRETLIKVRGGTVCEPNQIACADGSTCIDMALYMDGEADCPDGSDEEAGAPYKKYCRYYCNYTSGGSTIVIPLKGGACSSTSDCLSGPASEVCDSSYGTPGSVYTVGCSAFVNG